MKEKTYKVKVVNEYMINASSKEEIENMYMNGSLEEEFDSYRDTIDIILKLACNKYEIFLENGTHFFVDVSNEEDWGNIQPCCLVDCDNYQDAIGWGNDCDGHIKIVKVIADNKEDCWIGNNAINSWYDNINSWYDNYVSCYA